jgi:hypothetical protein
MVWFVGIKRSRLNRLRPKARAACGRKPAHTPGRRGTRGLRPSSPARRPHPPAASGRGGTRDSSGRPGPAAGRQRNGMGESRGDSTAGGGVQATIMLLRLGMPRGASSSQIPRRIGQIRRAEIRNPKEGRSPKSEWATASHGPPGRRRVASGFGFRISFGFRPSDFGVGALPDGLFLEGLTQPWCLVHSRGCQTVRLGLG